MLDILYPNRTHWITSAILFVVAFVGIIFFYYRNYSVNALVSVAHFWEVLFLAFDAYVLAYFLSPAGSASTIPKTIMSSPVYQPTNYDVPRIYNKLVRDKIPEYLTAKGVPYKIHIADDSEYESKLFEKLGEEVTEFTKAKNAEELVDILEVLDGIIDYKKMARTDIQNLKIQKLDARGGFTKRIILDES